MILWCVFALWHPTSAFVPPPMSRHPVRTSTSTHHSLHRQLKSPVALSAASLASQQTVNKNDSYLRWSKEGDAWNMQTAVTTFQRGSETVDLHAQLHFGDKSYFEFYNSPEFDKPLDHVHYELLVDDDLLTFERGNWRLETPIMASPNDQNLASQYDWACQAQTVDYTNPKWIHADLSRQEFFKLLQKDSADSGQMPLWKVASGPQSSSAAAEAVSALLVGPPTLSYSSRYLKRRLFTNLFLPGKNLANMLRAALWMTVPSPELSIILLDWSSLLKGGANPNALSQVALPILSSLVKLDIPQIRRFLFGQVLVSSNSPKHNEESSGWSLLVTKRNDHALDVLEKTLSESTSSSTSTALLYGSSHCPDLHSKLVSMGFRPTKTIWRTAWSVQENDQETILPALVAGLVFYLVIGALDWVGMMGDVSQAWFDGNYLDSGVAAFLYLLRHVLFYLGMSKFLVDWTNNND